jgi:16S rRNA (cytosine1402-N4)-methyltransferase
LSSAAGSPPGHEPVLVEEALGFLEVADRPDAEGWFVDCTLGLGGHAAALLERNDKAKLVGVDRDPRALEIARERLERFGERVRLVTGRFADVEDLLHRCGIRRVSGMLADLGVSSMQLETATRGFSFMKDGPLDMRMGGEESQGDEMTAHEVLRNYSEEELQRLLRIYGEERYARQISRAIVSRRTTRPLETTGELRQLIEDVKPRPRGPRKKRIHPATQTFQALRIEVNRELDELGSLLDSSVNMLEQNGRLVVISYHSLEDRAVKHTLRGMAAGKVEPVTGQPRAETQLIEVLTKRVVRPSVEEVERNPRSRSAKLRAARRL